MSIQVNETPCEYSRYYQTFRQFSEIHMHLIFIKSHPMSNSEPGIFTTLG